MTPFNPAMNAMVKRYAEQMPPHSGSAVHDNTEHVPIWHKQNLTVAEAVAYSGIGEKTIRKLMQSHGNEFVLMVGENKKLIKRQAFDEFMHTRKYI